ncbi:MAG TPA: hypothetical protein VFB31_10945 [Pseudolabrys sp.]|nr:hypothetical protein [Pseudolabrys sp.]
MSSDVELALAYNVANAPVRPFPYPHIYVPDVFPSDFYTEIQHNIPDPAAMVPIEQARNIKGYNERFVMEISGQQTQALPAAKKEFWTNFSSWLLSGRFMNLMMQKFGPFLQQRFRGMQGLQFFNEGLLVEDITKYALGPHTDSPRKVLTFLFYLPKDASQAHLGTSIYVPRDGTFTCPGGPHYGFDKFQRIATMPFLPNALFAFVKTDNSFHGVEPVTDPDTRRWLLLYDVYVRAPAQQQPVAEGQPAANVTFKM